MKRLIEKEFVDMSKLGMADKKEVEAANRSRLADLQHKYAGIRMGLHGREQVLYDRLAKQTGFSGYADGDTAYLDIQKKQFLRQPLTEDETAALKAFFNAKVTSPEYADICQAYKDTDRQELEDRAWAEQRYLNDVLTRTRWKYDTNLRVDGKLVQPPVSWNFWSSEHQNRMEVPCTESVTDKTGRGIPVDRGVASVLKQLWSAGIVTGYSCSGLVKDHPYHRYRMDDELGRWKKGQYRYQNKEFCHAYMTFPLKDNDAEVMTRIGAKAEDWGWTAEYGGGSLCLYPAHTLDGTSRSAIFDENRQRNEGYNGEMDDATWHRRFAEVERMHGGIIPYTDAMIEHLWRKLTRGILETQRQVMDERLKTNIETGQAVTVYEHSFQKTLDDAKARQLISDIEIRTRPDHNTYIRCRIQGQWQMGRQMTPEDTAYYRYRMSQSDKAYNGVAPELAHKYFREEISRVLNGQSRTAGRGM